jgi:hypothetical protein
MSAISISLVPSAKLVDLKAHLDAAEARRAAADADQEVSYVDYDAVAKACWDVLSAIADEEPATLGDLCVKAQTFQWSAGRLDDEPYTNPDDGEEKIMRQIIAGLSSLGGITR